MASDEITAQPGERSRPSRNSQPTMRWGTHLSGGATRFRLFAPAFLHADPPPALVLEDHPEPLPMTSAGDGWFELSTPLAAPGGLYRFLLPNGNRVADPASRFQPRDVEGPSEVIDPDAYTWHDTGWQGRPWAEAVLYELHIGTFTPEGTFLAAIAHLDHLATLGITAIELMGLTDFPGLRSWGYDGVLLFAPDSAYGRPDDLKAFIDAAHARGLMVLLDVVFNHFGPEGNYLPSYFPEIFSAEHKTAWGPGLNFDGPGNLAVRDLILQNALYWLREFHVDGLRLDASHALVDTSPHHILDELVELCHAFAAAHVPTRYIHLVLENETTVGRRLNRSAAGAALAYTAQWNHAIDHLLGAALGGECSGHDPGNTHEITEIGKALAEGFVATDLNCQPPEAEVHVPPTAFVSFIQTHDLVGNRPFGDRIHALAHPENVRALAAIYLLCPQIPMLFMGEEWAASTPFPYFCDFHGDLAKAVREGRCADMAKTGQLSPEELKKVPDPGADSTFRSAQLLWNELSAELHAGQLDLYRRLLAARREFVIPYLQGLAQACGQYQLLDDGEAQGSLTAVWHLHAGVTLHLAINLRTSASPPLARAPGEIFWLEGSESPAENSSDDQVQLGPWSVRWSLQR